MLKKRLLFLSLERLMKNLPNPDSFAIPIICGATLYEVSEDRPSTMQVVSATCFEEPCSIPIRGFESP